MAWLLAIDTATRHASVALTADFENRAGDLRRVFSRSWFSQHNHGAELMPKINEVLGDAGAGVADLSDLAIVTGPGSFSALRVGLATAQGMALAAGLRLIPVPTFEVEIEPWREHIGPICAVIDAGSSGVAWGLYVRSEQGLTLESSGCDPAAERVAACPGDTVFCGEAAPGLASHLPAARILSVDVPTRNPAQLLAAAFRSRAAGGAVDPSLVALRYARPPAVTTPAHRLPDGSRRQRAR